jgi:hypothetical protein
MLRIVLWSFIAVGLMSAPIALKARDDWRSIGAEIAQDEKSGALEPEAPGSLGPLMLAEKAVVVAEFDGTWGSRGDPCRALDWKTFERVMTGAERRLPGRTISSAVASLPALAHTDRSALEQHYRGVLVTCRLERRHTDKELLRLWLPHADFGGEAEGIDAAARAMFGKGASELNLDQASRLAALLRNPKYFSQQEGAWDERAKRIAARVTERGDSLK